MEIDLYLIFNNRLGTKLKKSQTISPFAKDSAHIQLKLHKEWTCYKQYGDKYIQFSTFILFGRGICS